MQPPQGRRQIGEKPVLRTERSGALAATWPLRQIRRGACSPSSASLQRPNPYRRP